VRRLHLAPRRTPHPVDEEEPSGPA
jgi:hypothetical protein